MSPQCFFSEQLNKDFYFTIYAKTVSGKDFKPKEYGKSVDVATTKKGKN